MANTCRTKITIQASREAIQDFVDRLENCVDGGYPNSENDKPHIIDEFGAKAELLIDRIGSKWIQMYDGYDSGISEHDDTEGSSEVVFELESAWYPPSDMILEMYRQVVEFDEEADEEVRVFGSYWDEAYNPIGVFEVYYGQIIAEENLDLDESEWDEKVEEEGDTEYDRNFWDEEVHPAFESIQKKLDKIMKEI
jgi:hypothetical protein|tara:strand:- start:2660 stop:3244 length:585 start_codon:yes stop_codon:yes gene_type:complete